jgi:hypothetical protein
MNQERQGTARGKQAKWRAEKREGAFGRECREHLEAAGSRGNAAVSNTSIASDVPLRHDQRRTQRDAWGNRNTASRNESHGKGAIWPGADEVNVERKTAEALSGRFQRRCNEEVGHHT